jgi:hypothetical protein
MQMELITMLARKTWGIAERLKTAERRMATPQIAGRDEPLGLSASQGSTRGA